MADPTRLTVADLQPMVSRASEQYSVPEEYIWGVIRAENSGSAKGAANLKDVSTQAISPKNARGVMQVTPIALKDVTQAGLVPEGLDHANLSVEDQIGVGTAYLSRLMKLSQKPEEIYAMYNFGPKARFRMDQLPGETQGYLEKTGSSNSSTVKTGGGGTGTFGQGMMGGGDLVSMLINSNNQQNSAMSAGLAESQQLSAQGQQLSSMAVNQQRAVVADAAITAADKANVTYTQNKTLEQLQSLFRMDPSQVDNEIAGQLAVVDTAQKAYGPARAEYDQLAGADFLSDPLSYILAQVQMPTAAAKVNAIADQEDIANQRLQTRTAQLTAAKSVITANTADAIRDVQLREAKQNVDRANAELTEKEAGNTVKAATNKLQNMQVANMIGDNTRNTLVAVSNLEDRAESIEIRKEQREQLMSGKKLKEEEDARLNARLKTISDAKGMLEPMTVARLRTLTDKKSQEEWLAAAQSSQLGESLEGSLRFYLGQGSSKVAIQSNGGASTWDTAERLARQGADYAGMAERLHEKTAPGGKKLTPEAARFEGYELYRNEVVGSMNSATAPEDLSSSTWNRKYNPYIPQFLSFNKKIESDPTYSSLKNNEVKKAIDTLFASGAIKGENLDSSQQQQVVKSIITKAAAREIDSKKAAADIAAYFTAAAGFNRTTNKYDLFSLPPQNAYFFTLEGAWPTMSKDKVNLMDPISVENKVIKSIKFGKPVTMFSDTGDFGVTGN
jgi:hypothetical protein